MAKLPTIANIVAGFGSYTQHNSNYTNIQSAFSNTLSRDGSTPNTMEADFDLNSNDLLNGGTLNALDIVIDGTSLSTQVTAAASSATAAATSASAAATSASDAAASYDSFNDIYLGAKASAPSLDNDGNALQSGALYFDTVLGDMFVWNGASWDALSAVVAAFTDLSDTPANYTGSAGKFIKVNVGETGLEFATTAASVGDADYGDITVSAAGSVWTIDDNVVDLAAMAHGTQGDLIYMAAAGAPTYLAAGTANKVLLTGGAAANPSWGNVNGTALRMGSDAQGDVLYYNGTNYVRLGAGTAGQFLKTNGAGANPAWATPSVSGSGTATQIAVGTSTTAGSTTTAIPFDNTIPQSTEGAEVVTVTITPTDAGSTILIEAVVMGSLSNNGTYLTGAIFVDSQADAIGANSFEADSSASTETMPVAATHAPGDTSAHTYKLRVGPSAGTGYWNRTNGLANLFSTAGPVAMIKVTEILP